MLIVRLFQVQKFKKKRKKSDGSIFRASPINGNFNGCLIFFFLGSTQIAIQYLSNFQGIKLHFTQMVIKLSNISFYSRLHVKTLFLMPKILGERIASLSSITYFKIISNSIPTHSNGKKTLNFIIYF